jgi:hypothetical protein
MLPLPPSPGAALLVAIDQKEKLLASGNGPPASSFQGMLCTLGGSGLCSYRRGESDEGARKSGFNFGEIHVRWI